MSEKQLRLDGTAPQLPHCIAAAFCNCLWVQESALRPWQIPLQIVLSSPILCHVVEFLRLFH